MHAFEDLEQAPSLALITLCAQDAFPFKIYVIDKGVAALWGSREALKLLLYIGSIGRRRFSEHFRKRAL